MKILWDKIPSQFTQIRIDYHTTQTSEGHWAVLWAYTPGELTRGGRSWTFEEDAGIEAFGLIYDEHYKEEYPCETTDIMENWETWKLDRPTIITEAGDKKEDVLIKAKKLFTEDSNQVILDMIKEIEYLRIVVEENQK